LRKIRQGDHPAVIVRVEPLDNESDNEDSELRVNVPCWMLDRAACANVQLAERPRIDVDALLRLRKLIDQLAKTSGEARAESGSMMAKGDRHETSDSTAARATEAASEAANP
jgi:hypothetical protein